MASHAVERDGQGMEIADRQLTRTGAIMGIGQALLEATTTGRTTARILNSGLDEYLIPAYADVPVIDVAFVEDRDDQLRLST